MSSTSGRIPSFFSVPVPRGPAPAGADLGAFPSARSGAGWLVYEGTVDRLSPHERLLASDPAHRVAALMLDRVSAEGVEALARVEGDFVAVYVDGKEVHAWKSFAGSHQLFASGDRVANRLLAFAQPGFELDPVYRDRFIVGTPSLQHGLVETPLRGVRRVPPGGLLTLGPRGVRERQLVQRRWRYLLDRKQTAADVAPRLRELIVSCVDERLERSVPGEVACELSGGLDSSFIACLVGRRVPGARAFMFARPDHPSFRSSEGYAKSVADRYGMRLSILTPSDLPAVDLGVTSSYGDEPSDFFWYGHLFGKALAERVAPGSVIYGGFGADQLFLRSPRFVPILVQRGELREARRVLREAAPLLKRSVASLSLQTMLSSLPRDVYRALSDPFAGRRYNPFFVGDVNPDWDVRGTVPFLRGGDLATAAGLERLERHWRAADEALIGGGVVCDDLAYFTAARAVMAPHYQPLGITEESPFCDLRLSDYVYGTVSAYLVHDFRARYKELLRVVQEGIVPDDLRARPNDTFTFDAFRSDLFAKNRAALVSLFETSELLEDDRWIDRAAFRRAFEELSFGLQTSATRGANNVLAYLLWWRDFRAAAKLLCGSAPPHEAAFT